MGTQPGVKRAIAIYGDKVYSGTSDTHIVALDAKTGRLAANSRRGGISVTAIVPVASPRRSTT